MWQISEFADEHEGRPTAVLPGGDEPAPLVFDVGSGSEVHTSTDWWDYDGTLGAPRAESVKAGCSCGWRGSYPYPIDWTKVSDGLPTPFLLDPDGPLGDWQLHIATIQARAVPLPSHVQGLLERIDTELEDLADQAPLAALRAAAALERTVERIARTAAHHLEQDGTPVTDIADGLGISPRAAHSRLLRYGFRYGY
ncbi:hypothetical protein ACWGCI_14405 [Streptomyces sp. NPDC054949]